MRSLRAPASIAGALVLTVVLAFGCGGEESSRAPVAAPERTRLVARAEPAREPMDASVEDAPGEDAAVPGPRGKPGLPEPMFGATEPVRPGDPHAFRLAASLRLMRATRSGANLLKMLSVIPEVIDARAATGIDPFADGEWLLVYGAGFLVPGRNANVVKLPRAQDGGRPRSEPTEIYGVRDVLLRPQPGVLALVPGDRAADLLDALAKPIDPGTKPGELARIFIAEPARLARFIPAEVVRATVTVKAATDGGLDMSAEADCPEAASCKATATAIEELAAKQNSLVVRIVLKNLLGNLAVRARGTKLEATLHAAPDQVDAVLNLTRAQLGLPAEDPADARK